MTAIENKRTVISDAGFFQPRRLAHVNLYIDQLNRTMDFYTNVLGIEETYRTPLTGGGFVGNGNTHHDVGFITADGPLGKPRAAKPGKLNHIAFELENEVALVEGYNRAVAAGTRFVFTADHDIAHSVYGTDPDGNRYELYADVVKDWRAQRSGIVTKPKPDWTPGCTPPVADRCYHENPSLSRVERSIFHPLRTTHATIVVKDLATSLDYYSKVVGLRPRYLCKENTFVTLGGTCQEHSLTLIQSTKSRPPGYHHVGLYAQNSVDLQQSVDKAIAAGVKINTDITQSGRRAVMIADADNCLTQIYCDNGGTFYPENVDRDLSIYLL